MGNIQRQWSEASNNERSKTCIMFHFGLLSFVISYKTCPSCQNGKETNGGNQAFTTRYHKPEHNRPSVQSSYRLYH